MSPILIAADLIAIVVLVFGLFLHRHQRRDMVVAYLVVNIGVLALMATLSATTTSVGVGLGLFGVLSIIRLRSEELRQHEVAYYFAALALGLLGGSTGMATEWVIALMVALVATLYLGDHPRLARRTERTQLQLDHAYTDEVALRARVESLVGGEVDTVTVVKIDLVNDTTLVDVRFTRRALPVPVEAIA